MRSNLITISKVLSPNDIGSTGAHQAGILVPKNDEILAFFPKLKANEKNPRSIITFIADEGSKWKLSFIFYNNKYFGGTRNEFRLTGMTKYFKEKNLQAGDEIYLERDTINEFYFIKYKRKSENNSSKLKLSGSWKAIKF